MELRNDQLERREILKEIKELAVTVGSLAQKLDDLKEVNTNEHNSIKADMATYGVSLVKHNERIIKLESFKRIVIVCLTPFGLGAAMWLFNFIVKTVEKILRI